MDWLDEIEQRLDREARFQAMSHTVVEGISAGRARDLKRLLPIVRAAMKAKIVTVDYEDGDASCCSCHPEWNDKDGTYSLTIGHDKDCWLREMAMALDAAERGAS